MASSGSRKRVLLGEEPGVVELALVGENVCIRVGGDGERPLSHRLADARLRDPAEMQERDTPMAQIMRREELHSGGARQTRAIAVRSRLAANPANTSDSCDSQPDSPTSEELNPSLTCGSVVPTDRGGDS